MMVEIRKAEPFSSGDSSEILALKWTLFVKTIGGGGRLANDGLC